MLLERLPCPVSTCHADNDVRAETCIACGVSLREYFRLSAYPAQLFNQGLAAARAGRFAQARDLFAAVISWCPTDVTARNAFAAACLELHDLDEARRQWETVVASSPADPLATKGLTIIANMMAARAQAIHQQARHGLFASSARVQKKKRTKKKIS